MDIYNTITVNNVTYKLDNSTDMHLDTHIWSDDGFDIYWRRNSYQWAKTLRSYGFETYNHGKIKVSSSDITELPLSIITMPMVINWRFGDGLYNWYGLYSDPECWIMQSNHGKVQLKYFL